VVAGFDQYQEPASELPAETRTFARLCASLTEEAEAIGWYEQRMAVEPDPEAGRSRTTHGETSSSTSVLAAVKEEIAAPHAQHGPSIGYESHDTDAAHLYLEESFTFQWPRPRRPWRWRPDRACRALLRVRICLC
jgi:hypothetical protein